MVSLAASLKRHRRSYCFANPLDDIGASRWGLGFANRQTEAAFAAGLSVELARDIAICAVIVIFVDAVWLAFFTNSLPDVYSSTSVDAYPVLMLIHGAVILVCLVNVVVATAQMRCSLLSPRSLEVFFVCCSTFCLMLIPFTEQALLFTLLGDMTEAKRTESAALGVGYLLVDCVVTVTSLLPLRWSTTWPVYLVASCWCAVVRLAIVGTLEGHSHAIATQVMLTLLGASGSRTLERNVRRLFFTVTAERTKRAQSEFLLEQQDSRETAKPRAPSTAQQSIDTQAIFGGNLEPLDIDSTLRLVEGVAKREQWLIGPRDIRVHSRRLFGQGSFGVVVAGTLSGLPVAVKLPIGRVHAEALKDSVSLISELRVFRKLRHPNIAMFIGAVIDVSLHELAVVMEAVVGPDLHDFVQSPSKFGGQMCDRSMYSIVCGLTRALQYLHSHQPCIVHGDLKPKNVLVGDADSSMPSAKLVDFGLSRILAGKVRPLGGTLRWIPPEQIGGGIPHQGVDVFAFGQISSFIVTGSQPFEGWSREAMFRSLKRRKVWTQMPPETASPCVIQIAQIGRDCGKAKAEERPRMSSVCDRLIALAELPQFEELLGRLKDKLWYGYYRARSAVELGKPDSESWEDAILWLQSHLRPSAKPSKGQATRGAPAPEVSAGQLVAQAARGERQNRSRDEEAEVQAPPLASAPTAAGRPSQDEAEAPLSPRRASQQRKASNTKEDGYEKTATGILSSAGPEEGGPPAAPRVSL